MTELKAKGTIILSILFNALGILAIPWISLLVLNLIDYKTGFDAAPYRAGKGDAQPVKSYKSMAGIRKKLHMHLLIIVGYVIDLLVSQSLQQIGFVIPFQIFAITIACWLCFNEIISIVENMADSGDSIPPFLMPVLKRIRKQINEIGEKENSEESEEE